MTPSAEFFGSPDCPLFGWLHPVTPSRNLASAPSLGVLLCPPLGQELSNTYRSQQAWALDLAGRGMPCLRMDYAGCGDSADPAPAEAGGSAVGAVSAWQASIVQGIAHLRARTGVRQVAMLAIRSGALLAGPVATQQADVAAFVAVAPVVSGRRLLREWRALQATAALQTARDDGTLEVAGALFSAATCHQLAQIALPELRWPPGLAVQLIDRDDLPGTSGLLAALQAQGLQVAHEPLGGIAAMLCEPQHHVVPADVVQATGSWLAKQAAGISDSAIDSPLRRACDHATVAPGVAEQVVLLGDHAARIFGILTSPVEPRSGSATLLLPNTGPVHHIGGHRLHVLMARHLAGQGHRVLRLDLTGLGDSPARAGITREPSYGPHAVDDLALVLQAVKVRWPDAPVQVLGLCAGGYHALRLAVRHAGAAQCFVVNPLVYHWQQGMTLDDYEMQLQSAYYRSKWRRWDSWQRLLKGRSDWRLLSDVARDKLLRACRRAALPSKASDDLGRDLQAAVKHGTRLRFVFSENEPGWPALKALAGKTLTALQASGALHVHHLDKADHTLSSADARERLIALVTEHLSGGSQTDGSPHVMPSIALPKMRRDLR